MKKIIFGIFAHPDDEAFGPSGTLLMEAAAGNDVHLVTLTAGDAGNNPDNLEDLGAVRLDEWRAAGRLIGASSMTCFHYLDGQLDNHAMIEIGARLVDHIQTTLADYPDDCQVEIMSMDSNGLTGHIDHIVASRASHYAFYKLKADDPRLSRLRLACLPRYLQPAVNTDWLYMDAGRDESEVGEIVDASQHRQAILDIMQAHHSQRHDAEQNIAQKGDALGIDYFLVKT